jgi:hypothetical protein
MPVVVQPKQLELFLTPEVDAAMDVEALAAAFNIDKMQVGSRKTIVRSEDVNIPGFQGMLATRDWFVCADTFMEMRNAQNPVALQQNFFWHHHQIHGISPFVPAILFTSEDAGTVYTITDYLVDGIAAPTIADAAGVAVSNGTVTRGGVYQLAAVVTTAPAGGPNTGVRWEVSGNQSPRTFVTQTGVLVVGVDEQSGTVQVRATSTSDSSYTEVLPLTVTGTLAVVTLGASADATPAALTNRKLPVIEGTPAVGNTLTASNGTWSATPDSYTLQWSVANAPVAGATGETYVVQAGDATKAITVAVTAVKAGHTSGTAVSKPVTVTA